MDTLRQLGFDKTFFFQFVLFVFFLGIVSQIYFKPFLALFQKRRQRTVEDRQLAEKMKVQAEEKLAAYQAQINVAKGEARQEFDTVVNAGKVEESGILSGARKEAKKIRQEALADFSKQRAQLKSELSSEVQKIAESVSDKLLVDKG